MSDIETMDDGWEVVKSPSSPTAYTKLSRLAVPGGWLYRHLDYLGPVMVFVPNAATKD
jgi:hypothetical protein